MISRFGHSLGMIYDLGEDVTDVAEIKTRSEYIRSIDPYRSPIMAHASVSSQDAVYKGLLGSGAIEIISINSKTDDVALPTTSWIQQSIAAKKPWVVTNDEQRSTKAVWGNLMAGGGGFQLSDNGDLTFSNFRSGDALYTSAAIAVNFFFSKKIIVSDMIFSSGNGFIALAGKTGKSYIVYKQAGVSSVALKLSGATTYNIEWINTRTGTVSVGSSVSAGVSIKLSPPGTDISLEMVAYLTCKTGC
jgi:hypothetical protein